MTKELKKRIITSIFLFILVFLPIVINKFYFTFAIIAISIICFYEWININIPYFCKKKNRIIFIQIGGLIYLYFFLKSSLFIYNELGVVFFIFIILICASSDIGGYVFGKIIGGKKLTKISPNKTVSGSIGSFIFSITPLALLNLQGYLDLNLNLSFLNIFFCLIISLLCQLGDLFISYFKRMNKVKNTGNILPGHGGLLDRIDGLLFAVPTAYILKLLQFF